jgi:membrane protease YdiL (CAAX protease family)
LALALASGCIHVRQARLTADEPPSEIELDALRRVKANQCSGLLAASFPGAAQLCLGKTTEGAALATLGVAELATGVTAAVVNQKITHPAAAAPLVAFQDAWVYSMGEWLLEHDRAAKRLFAPQDTLPELLVAPVNLEVLRSPAVWLGYLGFVAADMGILFLLGGPAAFDTSQAGQPPNLFGYTLNRWVGAGIAGAIGVSVFEHVAIAEETVFRGYVQSSLARAFGETNGWLAGAAIFGAFHALNLFFVPASERLVYATVGLPFVTLGGAYLGLLYRWANYSLAPGVAFHFWYDFTLSALAYLFNPQQSQLSASIRFPF